MRSVRALYPELPAILLSGDTAPDRLREAEAAGIALLHKPVAVADLAQAIARPASRSRHPDHDRRPREAEDEDAAPTAWISRGFEELVASRDRRVRDAEQVDFDVVIVGSGYGGAIAAARFAGATEKSGEPVTRLHARARPRISAGDVSAAHVRSRRPRPLFHRWRACARGEREGLFDVRVGADVSAVVANGLGGGSLINAGVMAEPRDDVFLRPEWPQRIQRANRRRCGANASRRCAMLLGAAIEDAGKTVDNTVTLNAPKIPAKFRVLRADGGLAEGGRSRSCRPRSPSR